MYSDYFNYFPIATSVYMSMDYNGPINHIEIFPGGEVTYGYYFYEALSDEENNSYIEV